MRWRDETTGQPLLWFKTTVQIAFGLILVIWVYKQSHTREDALERREVQRQQVAAEAQQEKARSLVALKAELQAHRADVIQGIQHSISSGAFTLALRDANRFHELNDPEIEQLINSVRGKAQAQEDQARAAILKKMVKKTDEIEKIDWYKDAYSEGWGNNFFLYVGKRSMGKPWLRLEIRYFALDWLFIDSFTVVADDTRYDRPQVKFRRENGSGHVWETYDENLSADDLGMIRKIIQSKVAMMRLHGDQGVVQDRTIKTEEKVALQNVLQAYEALGGNLGDL